MKKIPKETPMNEQLAGESMSGLAELEDQRRVNIEQSRKIEEQMKEMKELRTEKQIQRLKEGK